MSEQKVRLVARVGADGKTLEIGDVLTGHSIGNLPPGRLSLEPGTYVFVEISGMGEELATVRDESSLAGRPLTVAELVFRLADFEGDELVYTLSPGGVRSARRMRLSGPNCAILFNTPGSGESCRHRRRRWRGIVEALRGLAAVRVRRGPLGTARGDR